MHGSGTCEAIWTLWSYLWFLGRNAPKAAGSIFGLTEDDASDKICEIALMVGAALSFGGFVEDRSQPMNEQPIPSRVLANIESISAAELMMAPFYWSMRALVATREERPGTREAELVSVANERVQGLYGAWQIDTLASMLVVAYPDAMEYVHRAGHFHN